jgi:hypothetical protein
MVLVERRLPEASVGAETMRIVGLPVGRPEASVMIPESCQPSATYFMEPSADPTPNAAGVYVKTRAFPV